MRPLLVWLLEPEVSAEALSAAREAGLDAVLLRRPGASAQAMVEGVRQVKAAGLAAIVNDRLDVALALCTPCQLRHDSLPPRLARAVAPNLPLGASVHGQEQVDEALAAGVDYLIFGHVFATRSKPGLPPRGIVALRALAASVDVPVLAIGGISPDHAGEVAASGAAGVVVGSGIAAHRAATDVARFRRALDDAQGAAHRTVRDLREVLRCACV